MENTIYSLLPPLIAIIMVILTRRVLVSLGIGIISAAIILANLQFTETMSILFTTVKAIFIEDGALNSWNVFIILFLLILGVITAFISITGGSRAFGDWAMKRVKTRAGAQLVTAFLGILFFIDDYFNALTVGQVSRPITDRQRVSRAKLAYIIDSTSAPVCVIAPISSWGAFIIAIIGSVLVTHQVTDITAFSAFIQMIPMNLYVWVTLLLVFLTAIFNIGFGSMKAHEERAWLKGEVFNPSKQIPGELKEDLPVSKKGSVGDLVWPIIVLVAGTVSAMFWTGYQNTDGAKTAMAILDNTDVALSLFSGGILGLVTTLFLYSRQLKQKAIKENVLLKGIIAGIKSMLPAVYILIFAWAIVDLIGQLETGTYLAGVVTKLNIHSGFLPVMLFIIAGIMGFSTGTSWGSFGILIPIAGDIAAATDISLLLPGMAAVLAGAVFGDHCSPISDTTILSSTGAGCNHMDHVITQLPYALIAAAITAVGYVTLGFTGSTIISLAVVVAILFAIASFFRQTTANEVGEQVVIK